MNKKYLIVIIVVFLCLTVIYFFRERQLGYEFQFPCGVAATDINDIVIDSMGVQLVMDTPFKWEVDKVRVYFMDVKDESVISRTIEVANEWSKYADIKFKKSESIYRSDIRVSFREKKGYQPVVGNKAKLARLSGRSTLFLQDLDKKSESEFKRVILHEFGHALGLRHELRSPDAKILWDKPKVYKYFEEVYGWNTTKVDSNVLAKVNTDKYSKFDKNSIMIYAIPDSLTKDKTGFHWPKKLSRLDKTTIGDYYPF